MCTRLCMEFFGSMSSTFPKKGTVGGWGIGVDMLGCLTLKGKEENKQMNARVRWEKRGYEESRIEINEGVR